MFLHFPLISADWCFCNIRAGSLSHLDFVPAAVPGLSCMAALGTKAKWLCSAHKRVFLLVFTRHELSLRIPVWEKLTLAEFPSLWFRDCTAALSCADWESNLWIGANAFCLSFSLQTYIGSVVISMNPYRSLPIYTPEKVEEYRNRNFYELSPHMWVQL